MRNDDSKLNNKDTLNKGNNEGSPVNVFQKKVKHLKIAVVGSYILIAILFLLLLFCRCNCPMNNENSDLEKGSIDMVQPRDLQEEINKAVEMGMSNVFMNTNIYLEDGKEKANLLIQNMDTNPNPMFVEIYLKDSNELIYISEEIPVGYKVEEAKLNKLLDKGTYDCIAYFNIINEASKEVMNRIGLNVKLTVNN